MDSSRFKFIEWLSPGIYGRSYIAEDNTDHEKVVIKQIESADETSAKLASLEFSKLFSKRHIFFQGPKHCFLTWDKKTCSMLLNIVTPYISGGSLHESIAAQNQLKESFKESLIRKWISQLMESLSYLHTEGFVHRNLHTKNIYLTTDTSLVVSDVIVPPLMGAMRINPRVDKKALSWLSPQFMSLESDAKSEVWSLGYCILSMLGAGPNHRDLIQELLSKLHSLSQEEIKDEIFSVLSETYSSELLKTVNVMLTVNHQHRPSLNDLIGMEFIKSCLNMSGSALLDRKRKQEATVTQIPLPAQSQGIAAFLEYIEKYIHHELLVQEAAQQVSQKLTSALGSLHEEMPNDSPAVVSNHLVNSKQRKVLMDALVEHAVSEHICASILHIFCILALEANADDIIFTPAMVNALIMAVQHHHNNREVMQMSCGLSIALATSDELRNLIGTQRGIEQLYDTLKFFLHDALLFTMICNALWVLSISETNLRHLAAREDCLYVLCNGMKWHFQIPEALEHASALLFALSIENFVVKNASDAGVVETLLRCLKKYPSHTKLIINVCHTLSSFVQIDEESALIFINCEPQASSQDSFSMETMNNTVMEGMPLIQNLYNIHKGDPNVVEAIAKLIQEITNYEDLIAEIMTDSFVSILRDMRKKYIRVEKISKPCEVSLRRMGLKLIGK